MRSTRGFTLLELMIALMVLGLLVAIALNRTNAKARAYVAVMQSDLRNFMTAQEAHYADHREYGKENELDFRTSAYVNLVGVSTSADGWSARVMHQKRTDVWCAAFVGNPNPIFAPAQVPGVIACGDKGGGGGGSGGNQGNPGNQGNQGKGKP